MTGNERQEAFDKWYDENYDEWAEGEEGIALREELEQAFKSGIAELEKENAELKARVDNLFNSDCWASEHLTKAKEIILRLYNAGRDVLMCRAEEKAYDNLSNAINDKSIAQFLSEVENV